MVDKLYQQSVNMLALIRDDWLKEHVSACEVRLLERSPENCQREHVCEVFPPPTQQVFETQAKERINYLRNKVWTHLNQLSQQCVTSDEVKPC